MQYLYVKDDEYFWAIKNAPRDEEVDIIDRWAQTIKLNENSYKLAKKKKKLMQDKTIRIKF